MKKLILGIILVYATLAMAATKPADYSGNWTLDKTQSKNLPQYYENIEHHKLAITQDEKLLTVAVEIKRKETAPDKFDFKYNLEGTETKTEPQIRTQNGLMSVPATLKAVETGEGKLQITISRQIPLNGTTFNGVTVEDWKLSADGKTLTIHKTDETPRGKLESDMIFVKE